MRIVRAKKTFALVAAGVVSAALAATGLSAVWAQVVHVDSAGGLHYRIFSTSADSFDSGWHTHPGIVVFQVREGTFQITQGSCTPKAVGPGETFIEVPFLPIRAVATGRVVWTTTILTRIEDPVSTPVASPCP